MSNINKLISVTLVSSKYIKEDDAEIENLNSIEKAIVDHVIVSNQLTKDDCMKIAQNLNVDVEEVKKAVHTLLVKLIIDFYVEPAMGDDDDDDEDFEEGAILNALKQAKEVISPVKLDPKKLATSVAAVRG
jgi:hypothetical protein